MWFLDDLYISRIRRQHPNGNLQTPSGGIQDGDRAVSSLGFADDLNAKAAERMEWIENTNLLGFCAQGMVSVVANIPIFTASCPAAPVETGQASICAKAIRAAVEIGFGSGVEDVKKLHDELKNRGVK